MLLTAAILAIAPVPRTHAQDVRQVSDTCLKVASGQAVLPNPSSVDYAKGWKALGLDGGIENATLNALGPAVDLISQAAIGHRDNGTHRIVFAAGGRLPGCRTILVGTPITGIADAVARDLLSPTAEWREFSELKSGAGPINKRGFLRRVDGKPYLLNLIELTQPMGQVHLFTTVIAVPPQVTLPKGF